VLPVPHPTSSRQDWVWSPDPERGYMTERRSLRQVFRGDQTPNELAASSELRAKGRVWWPYVAMVLTVVALLAAVVAGIIWLNKLGIQQFEFELPLLVIGGATALFIVLGTMFSVFNRAGASDSTQALGLPQGSIRALIALLFILMFVIVTVFLQGQVSADRGQIQNISEDTLNFLIADPTVVVVHAEYFEEGDEVWYDVNIRVEPEEASSAFADRVFATLSTLVVALSAFYFGHRAVAIAQAGQGREGVLEIFPSEPTDLPEGGRLDITAVARPEEALQWELKPPVGSLAQDSSASGAWTYIAPDPLEDDLEVQITFSLRGYPDISPKKLTVKKPSATTEEE